jgi:hypothetical protein
MEKMMNNNILKRFYELSGKPHLVDYKPVMEEYYGILSNEYLPVRLDEVTVDRVLDQHGNNGLIMISANRSNLDNKVNNENTRLLISDIKKSGFSYFPVYGGYKGSDDVVDTFEPSFVIVNYDKRGNKTNFENLFNFGVEMCGKYKQDTFLVKSPNGNPEYFNGDGQKVSTSSTNNVKKNDPSQEYFTSLIKTKNLDKENPQRLKRFTYDINFECYYNPFPTTLNERMRRDQSGEILPIKWLL